MSVQDNKRGIRREIHQMSLERTHERVERN